MAIIPTPFCAAAQPSKTAWAKRPVYQTVLFAERMLLNGNQAPYSLCEEMLWLSMPKKKERKKDKKINNARLLKLPALSVTSNTCQGVRIYHGQYSVKRQAANQFEAFWLHDTLRGEKDRCLQITMSSGERYCLSLLRLEQQQQKNTLTDNLSHT